MEPTEPTSSNETIARQLESVITKIQAKKAAAKARRKAKEEAMKSLGMVKVRGALGGTYWE